MNNREEAPFPFSVCVYCGSRAGLSPAYARAAIEAGRLIAGHGAHLVYGGGRAGLMGAVADAALRSGARVVGVIPRSLMDRELGHAGLNELHVVETMHQRKQMMAERSHAFLALPGGIGTLEELFEVWTWLQLGYHDKPIGLLNVEGYFDALLGFLDRSAVDGFISGPQRAMLHVDTDPGRLLARLAALAPRQAQPADRYRAI